MTWRYMVLRLRDIDADDLLATGKPAVMTLIGQARMKDPERVIRTALEHVATVTDKERQKVLLVVMTHLMDDKEEIHMLERLLYQIEHEGLLGETPFMVYMREKEEKMREERYAQWREEGREEGREKERQAMALRMLAIGVDRATILQVTGMSDEELTDLATRNTPTV